MCIMWGRAGRHSVGIALGVIVFFIFSMIFNFFNTNDIDNVEITGEQLRVLRAFNPPLAKSAPELQVDTERLKATVAITEGAPLIRGPKARSDAVRARLEQTCEQLNITLPLTDYMLSHMHFDHTRKAIYCFIPKVACTSWKRIWMKMTGIVKPEKDLSELTRYVIHTSIPTLTSQKKLLPDIMQSYKKFMFVRHPFDRVLSAYKDKLESEDKESNYNFHKEIGARIQKKYRKPDTNFSGDNVTFPEFIRFISEPGRGTFEQRNEHWLSVHEICNPCGMKYDFIGKYENLKEDADYVLDWLGASDLIHGFPVSDRPFHARRYDPKYFSQLTRDDKRGFYSKYLEDFLAFNYTFI